MPHADSLILTLVGGFVLAFVFGMLANRLKLSNRERLGVSCRYTP